MSDREQPQLYLITPPVVDLDSFPGTLAGLLDAMPIACVRLALASRDERVLGKTADALREVAHARDVPLVIDSHVLLVERHGLDGVHLPDGGKGLRKLRDEMGGDVILGAYCGTSRHVGMAAGEAGADYIAFGPVEGGSLGDGSVAETDLFAWWSEMIELPVVAEGGLTVAAVERLAPVTDFFAIGDEIWTADDPRAALTALTEPLR